MAHPKGKKEESRARILASAARGFRKNGFGAAGVDGLVKEAGVTSGAFYAHFDSKATAFREAVSAGMEDLLLGVERMREALGSGWREGFIDFYLGDRRTCDLAESCALQSLTGEVARADDAVRAEYERQFRRVIDAVAAGLEPDSDDDGRGRAIALLAILVGGVSMARAVKDASLAEEVADSVRRAAISMVEKAKARRFRKPGKD